MSACVCLSKDGQYHSENMLPGVLPMHSSEPSGWRLAEATPEGSPESSVATALHRARAEAAASPHRTIGQSNPAVKLFFYHLDHLGTPRVITDVAGQLVSKHKYLPFGEELSPPPSTNSHKFTGHERDKETGLDYMLARYYGPATILRFSSVDPGGGPRPDDPQTWNRYAYVRNNPINTIDPTGLLGLEGGLIALEHQMALEQAGVQSPPAASTPLTLTLSLGVSFMGGLTGADASLNLNLDNKGGSSFTVDAQSKFGLGLEAQAGPSASLQPGTVEDIESGTSFVVSGGYLGEFSLEFSNGGGTIGGSIKGVGAGGSITGNIGGPVVNIIITQPNTPPTPEKTNAPKPTPANAPKSSSQKKDQSEKKGNDNGAPSAEMLQWAFGG